MLWTSNNNRSLRKRLLLSLALTLTVGSTRAAESCLLSNLSACENINELIGKKSFQKEVKEFLSRQHGNYAVRGETVSDQALDLLGGPPDIPKKLANATLFSACMADNCGEKGAALLDPLGRIKAIGMLDACNARTPSSDCFAHDTLTEFIRGEDERTAAIAALSDWAKSAIVAENSVDPGSALPKTKLDRIQAIYIVSPNRH